MHYLGIDVHKRDSQLAVLDDVGELVGEQRIENDQFAEVAEAYVGSKAALETTGNYFAIVDTLEEHLDVQVADPRQTKAIGIAEVKNDRLDAKLLAQLCRAGMIAESYVPTHEIRELRSLARGGNASSRNARTSKTRSTHCSISKGFPTIGIHSAETDEIHFRTTSSG